MSRNQKESRKHERSKTRTEMSNPPGAAREKTTRGYVQYTTTDFLSTVV
jgi:hypothetical protein